MSPHTIIIGAAMIAAAALPTCWIHTARKMSAYDTAHHTLSIRVPASLQSADGGAVRRAAAELATMTASTRMPTRLQGGHGGAQVTAVVDCRPRPSVCLDLAATLPTVANGRWPMSSGGIVAVKLSRRQSQLMVVYQR